MRHADLLLYRTMSLFILVTACLFLLSPAHRVFAADSDDDGDFSGRVQGMTQITGLRMSNNTNNLRIVVDASRAVKFKQSSLSNPTRVVVDIQNAWLSPKITVEQDTKSKFAGHVRIAQFDKKTVRVVVETKTNNIRVFALNGGTVPGRVVMDFGSGTATSNGQKKTDIDSNSNNNGIQTPDTPAPNDPNANNENDNNEDNGDINNNGNNNASDDNNGDNDDSNGELQNITKLQGRTITIDAGHGGNDSGAIGPTGVMEKSVTLRVATELRKLLEAEGATVYMTRTDDTEVSPKGASASDIEELQARCDVANSNDTDIFVSLHMDSFTSPDARGTTGYYYGEGSDKSRILADTIRADLIEALGTPSRGTKAANFYVIKHTKMPATLIEMAFISNPDEERLMVSDAGIKAAAQGIADGIADYFG